MSFHDETQIEFTYGRSRRQRRLLVAGMWAGAFWPLLINSLEGLAIKDGGPVPFYLVMGGLLLSFVCWLALIQLMKDINDKSLDKLDERQVLVSGRAYKQAFHIVMIVPALVYLFWALGWLGQVDFQGDVRFKLIMWPWILLRWLPMCVLAWTEPN
jgi:hypothetical protein